jgi:hypothetical protein
VAKQIDIEQVQAGIENQGFSYYMEHYASGDLKDTVVWPLVEKYIQAQRDLEDALRDAGVELDG